MNKFTFISILSLSLIIESNIASIINVNGIAIKVNGIPITKFDIEHSVKELKISRDNAVKIQINKALEQSEIEKFELKAENDEIENMLNYIMKNFNISSKSDLYAMAQRDGISRDEFLKNIEFQILQPQLYRKIAMQKTVQPSEDELQDEYKKNKQSYLVGEKYRFKLYYAKDPNELIKFKENPLKKNKNIYTESLKVSIKDLHPEQISILNNLKVGEFSNIIKFDNKIGIVQLEAITNLHYQKFEDIREKISESLIMARQKEALERYFQKLKAEATIEYLR
jgi:hypothetical protein